jgi:hypothetical protein
MDTSGRIEYVVLSLMSILAIATPSIATIPVFLLHGVHIPEIREIKGDIEKWAQGVLLDRIDVGATVGLLFVLIATAFIILALIRLRHLRLGYQLSQQSPLRDMD